MDIHLTNEQAKWLVAHLDALLEDRDWGRVKMEADQREHAQTIHDKIDKVLISRQW
jgi:hypothetical protein